MPLSRVPAILLLLLLASQAWSQSQAQFYDKSRVKGFISLKGDYRQMNDEGMDNLNDLLFESNWSVYARDSLGQPDPTLGRFVPDTQVRRFGRFEPQTIGLGVEVGAQYQKLMTWVDVHFMPSQVSPAPAATTDHGAPLWDVEWFSYGADWMWGWMLAPENSAINLIPSVGFGFSLLNVHFASSYELNYSNAESAQLKPYSLENTVYSTFGKSFNTELELRFTTGVGISLGGYAGYRVLRYDEFVLEEDGENRYIVGDPDQNHDSWFVGGKVTYTMPSVYENKQKDRL